MKKQIHQIIVGLSLAGLLAGCAVGKEETKTTEIIRESSGKQRLESLDWNTDSKSYGDTTVVVTKELTPESHALAQKELRETTLESLNLSSHLNVNAFTIRSRGGFKTKNAVYFAPKLYFYRTGENASVQVKQFGDNVLIPLHAILVDGLSSQIVSADGITKVELPESYKVNENAVREELIKRGYDSKMTFGPLDGCPKAFSISVAGKTFDVTPQVVQDSNQCEINRPFTLNLVVPKKFADFIVNEALYNNELDATATFQVLVGYVDAETFIQLDRKKVYESLDASLTGQYPPYGKAELEVKLKKIIQNETASIFIKGNRDVTIDQLIKIAMESMTVPFQLQPGAEVAKKDCTEMVCLNISYEKNEETRYLEVSYQQFSTTLIGQNVTSFAKPQQILFPQIALKSEGSKEGSYVDNREGRQNVRNLMLTANPGAIVEVRLLKTMHELDNDDVKVSTYGYKECQARDWTKRCEWHMYYLDVTRNYLGIQKSPEVQVAGNILGNPGQELSLIFTSSNGKVTKCSFDQLNGIGMGNKYLLKIENSPNCMIFSNEQENKEQVSISFANQLRDSKRMKQINDGKAFSISERYEKKDSPATGDTTALGGNTKLEVKEVERGIQLSVEILLRKYELTQVE